MGGEMRRGGENYGSFVAGEDKFLGG